MAELILVTGGARSGKSRFAENLLADCSQVLYVATATASDAEMTERIRMHQAARKADWVTLEAFTDLAGRLPPLLAACKAVLVDCLTLLVSNLMLQEPNIDWDKISVKEAAALEERVTREVTGLLRVLADFQGRAVIVTNELGMGLVPAYPLGRYFRDTAGRMNQLAASRADRVYLLVAGIPVAVKEQQP